MSNFQTLSFGHSCDPGLDLKEFANAEDEQLYNDLIKDDYIGRKCADRDKRIKDIRSYINELAPEILSEDNKNLNNLFVVDIGPGPGELLEIARNHGYDHLGFDALLDDCEMGDKYIRFSHLMTRRQDLKIDYCDFYKNISNLPLANNSTVLINSRGSIEQVFRDHLEGVPHKVHKDANRLAWRIDEDLKTAFDTMFNEFSRVLLPNGIILIHGNGASNVDDYNKLIFETISKIDSLQVEASDEERLHKIRKTQ